MTFDAQETIDGRPIELYSFFSGGLTLLRTNAIIDVNVGGSDYESLAGVERTEPTLNNEINSGEIEVVVPSDFVVATQFRFTLPSVLPTLTIFRLHLTDVAEEMLSVWKGEIVSCKFGDNTSILFCLPITKVFDKPIPARVYSATCNWQLYRRGCLVVRATYTKSTVLTSTDPTGQVLTITTLRTLAETIDTDEGLGLTATELDNFWMRGVVNIKGSPGERRAIMETDIGSDPNVVRINRPFVETSLAGIDIDVSAGCNHNINEDCSRKFLNHPNFGGFPTVPRDNPFQIELDGGATINANPRRTPSFWR